MAFRWGTYSPWGIGHGALPESYGGHFEQTLEIIPRSRRNDVIFPKPYDLVGGGLSLLQLALLNSAYFGILTRPVRIWTNSTEHLRCILGERYRSRR
jgi:hypothetical protein